jgi:hypothetical protein
MIGLKKSHLKKKMQVSAIYQDGRTSTAVENPEVFDEEELEYLKAKGIVQFCAGKNQLVFDNSDSGKFFSVSLKKITKYSDGESKKLDSRYKICMNQGKNGWECVKGVPKMMAQYPYTEVGGDYAKFKEGFDAFETLLGDYKEHFYYLSAPSGCE